MDLSRFTPEQRDVICAPEGPLSVLAGPGSGKTTTLAGRVAYLITQRATPPTSVLALTFTTAAASTLRSRLETVLGPLAHQVDIRTFHSLGLRMIRAWSEELGFGPYPPAVYAREDARLVLRAAARELGIEVSADGLATSASNSWALPLAPLERAVERLRLGYEAPPGASDGESLLDRETLTELSTLYERQLRAHRAVDYPAMLALPLRLLESSDHALSMLQGAYRWVLTDEFQDCCHLQAKLLRRLVDRHRNITVVGDPVQSIYGFRGADPRLLVDFPEDYPDARVITLEQNHRSTRTIVSLANALVAHLADRAPSWTAHPEGPAARVFAADDEAGEAHFISSRLQHLLATGQLQEPGQAAILVRTNAQTRALAPALRARGIPVRVRSELDLFACAEIRDLVAYLRLVHSPQDGPALARVLNTPPRGLRFIEHAFRRQPVPATELADWAHRRGGAHARAKVELLLEQVASLHVRVASATPTLALDAVLETTGYLDWLRSSARGDTHASHVEDLRTLAATFTAPDLATWLADLHLDEAGDPGADSHAVQLLTIHRSKGCEWPVVFIGGFEEGLIPFGHGRPGQADDDEERRLAYVALSRSQVQVYLTWCRTRRRSDGQQSYAELRQPSRYLTTMPAALVQAV